MLNFSMSKRYFMPSANNNNPDFDDQWRDLAVLAQGGDQKAYSKLLTELSHYIRNFVMGSLSNPDAAEDIMQEVLISVHKSLKTYSPDRPFKPWLIAIINFRRTDYLRKHYNNRQNKKTDLDDAGFQKMHVTNPVHAGELKDIEAALDTLPKKQRRIFEMLKIHGYSAKEVAKELNMSVSAVKVSAHRTQKKLQDIGQG